VSRSPAGPFVPAPGLRGPHRQTLWAALVRRPAPVPVAMERLDLPDGDFLDLAWTPDRGGPLVLVLHGLEGGLRSPYARGILGALHRAGALAVLMHFRGCSGEPNRRPQRYHFGDTTDLAFVLEVVRRRHPGRPLGAVGFSLGGNVLLKWLGLQGKAAGLDAAAAVSVPYSLHHAAERLDRGLSRIYQAHLLRRLKQAVASRRELLAPLVDVDAVLASRSFREFDDRLTAPLYGFRDAGDYYTRASALPQLRDITAPTLLVHAEDDPFVYPHTVPAADELSEAVILELTRHGGHVGFVSNRRGSARYWHEPRVLAHFQEHLGGIRLPPAQL